MVEGKENGFSRRTDLSAHPSMLHSGLIIWVSKYSLGTSVFLSVKEIKQRRADHTYSIEPGLQQIFNKYISFLLPSCLVVDQSVSPNRP